MFGDRRHRGFVIIGLIAINILLVGCWAIEEFVLQSESEYWEDPIPQLVADNTPEPITEPPVMSEPVEQSGVSSQAGTSDVTGNFVEYSVSAVNNGCTCQVSGNLTYSLEFQGDTLIRTMPDGSSLEYEKVSQNRYQRNYMSYEINIDKTGGKEVQTRIDREDRSIIILTDTGFMQEHYQGNAASACCTYTFTNVNQAP